MSQTALTKDQLLTELEQLKEIEQELIRCSDEKAFLLTSSQNLNSTLDLETVLQISIDETVSLMGLGTGAIYLKEGEMLRLMATTPPLPPNFPEEFRMAPLVDHPHIRQSITTKQLVTIDDTESADLTPAEKAVTEARDLRTLLYIPLIGEKKELGVIILGSIGETCVFSETRKELCRTLANLITLAVHNAILFKETIEAKDKVIEEMEAHNEYVKEVADRLRNPLQAYKGCLELLNKKDLSQESINEFLEYIKQSAKDLEDGIKKLT